MLGVRLFNIADGVVSATNTFSSDQITSITNSLNSAITNTLNMFVALLPVFATLCGVVFGIRFVKSLFNRTSNAR